MAGDFKNADVGRYLDASGRVSAWPAKRKNQLSVLAYLAERFERGRKYSEREVNEVLQQWHTWGDPALLRRALFDERFMDRAGDGSQYWRTGG